MMTGHAIDTLTAPGLAQETRLAVRRINALADEARRRGLIFKIGIDPTLHIDDSGKDLGPYVEATVLREIE